MSKVHAWSVLCEAVIADGFFGSKHEITDTGYF